MTSLVIIGSLTIAAALATLVAIACGLIWDAAQALLRARDHRAMERTLASKGPPHA